MKKIIPVILIITLLLPTYILLASSPNSNDVPSYYKKVLINSGDTLISISSDYNTSSMSNKDFVRYIKNFNGLKSNDIYYGNFIIIPIFDNDTYNVAKNTNFQ